MIANTGCDAWFAANVDVLFQDNGPLGTFTPICHQMLQRHFGVALRGLIANTGSGAWFAANVDILFQDNRPLGTFTPIRRQMLQRHFCVALRQARVYYTQQHSIEQSGAGKEEIPAWA